MEININEEIITLLENNLINPEKGLTNIFNEIKKYYKSNEDESAEHRRILHPNLLKKSELVGELGEKLKDKTIRTMAIDFPIEINWEKNSKRPKIMICALDPYPHDSTDNKHWSTFFSKENNFKELERYISPWAPFSLIDNWELKKGSNKYIPFFSTLFKEYDLYVTDIYKLFYREGDKKSTNLHSKEIKKHFKFILEKEVEIIKPTAIVTLGNVARDGLLKIINNKKAENWDEDVQKYKWIDDKTTIISIPHVSSRAYKAKTNILKAKKYENKETKEITDNMKLANIVLYNIKNGIK
ncbi:MAG: hypothetical protein A2X02_09860 [Bacteroidetes bacterium GWF2_29_10]|nr:MAG: hypothetical protein A2X02_09860 [Bacteroidetes bacterium GWF2_29_10]